MNIKELAVEAGARVEADTIIVNGKDTDDFVKRFAKLVAAAERESCAKLCEEGVDYPHPTVEHITLRHFNPSPVLAAAIRARGDKHE